LIKLIQILNNEIVNALLFVFDILEILRIVNTVRIYFTLRNMVVFSLDNFLKMF